MKKEFIYHGNKTNEISFPLGGIGSGCIGLAGNGRLIDWEIFNQPNKNSYNGFSFFAVKAEHQGKLKWAKVLQGDLKPPYVGSGQARGKYGFGVDRESLSGLPHYQSAEFKGEFPFAEISFLDEESPIEVTLTAFNPFIPLNDKDSSLPAAIFSYEVMNRSSEQLDISLIGCLTNPFNEGGINQFEDFGNFEGIKLYSNAYEETSPKFGDLTLSSDGEDTFHQTYLYRGDWFDNLTVFWKEFITDEIKKDRIYSSPREHNINRSLKFKDIALLGSKKTLEPGEKGIFRFIITWNIPNFVNYWNPGSENSSTENYPSWKNYYATLFKDSSETTHYVWNHMDRLYSETKQFKDVLFRSTFPDTVIDAISANLSILKSPTCARLTDGTLYGFEGCSAEAGCCEGSCTHVWNYEQVTPFLFPDLARSMRNATYDYAQFENGKLKFRVLLPLEVTLSRHSLGSSPKQAAADGQMGDIFKVYREWKISGDTNWLRSIWPKVKKSLEYAWDPSNTDWWDKDKDGVMEGIQHHTLDVSIYGPNTYITGYYHVALLTAAMMAKELGDEAGSEYLSLYEKGRKWVDENLFNGEYFHQQIDLKDERFPIDPELGVIKYQIGEGCHIDQVIGQWYAHILGIGYIFDEDKVKKSMRSIFKYNFINDFRNYANACRIYALNDEKGLMISTWPKDNSPKVPVPYADECMNGFEYQAACHMIYEGMLDEGITVVKAIRDRYDGERRNPWNEFECGSNYARSMASYSLLLALSGFEYDTTQHHIGFNPKINKENFRTFWSLNKGWGEFVYEIDRIRLTVIKGELDLQSFVSSLLEGRKITGAFYANQPLIFQQSDNRIEFPQICLTGNQTLEIKLVS